jgi:hypothetical protein
MCMTRTRRSGSSCARLVIEVADPEAEIRRITQAAAAARG